MAEVPTGSARPTFNDTKLRAANDARSGSWITEGREIENYLPPDVAKIVFGQPLTEYESASTAHQAQKGKRLEQKKAAKEATPLLTPDNWRHHDLEEQVRQLVDANRQVESQLHRRGSYLAGGRRAHFGRLHRTGVTLAEDDAESQATSPTRRMITSVSRTFLAILATLPLLAQDYDASAEHLTYSATAMSSPAAISKHSLLSPSGHLAIA